MDAMHVFLLISLFWYVFFWAMTDTSPVAHFIANFRTFRGLLGVFVVFVMAIQALEIIHFDLPYLYQNPMNVRLGIPIMLAGLTLACWAKAVMKTNWGGPAQHDIAKQKALVTTGPFTYTRNPIYLGILLFVIGFELALASWLIAAAIPLFVLIRMAIAREETLLKKHFGKAYMVYCNKVPRFLFF